MSPSCFGLPGLSGSPASSLISSSSRGLLLRELAGQPRQHLPVDRDAAPLHARRAPAPADAPASRRRSSTCSATRRGFSTLPQPQRRRRRPRRRIRAAFSIGTQSNVDLRLAGAGDLRRSRSAVWPSQRSAPARPCRGRRGRHRARRTSAWCRRRARTSMPRSAKICQSNLRFWPTLSTPGSSSSGLIASSASLLGNLVRRRARLRREQIAAALLPPSRWPSGT